jgi:hypothetical protein
VTAIVALLIANGWSVTDVKTVLLAVLSLVVIHGLCARIKW